ncbi:MAG TPA: 50S ribosomal protein L15 [Spirochaetota bacterium]|nr:50S ribosomal protein L15 [Spirochaetota bacterium]HNT11251.1 50S ribosomal protein L15 [Spirochaetota bacterium]
MSESYRIQRPANLKTRKRVGRGTSSGSGKTSARGQKGQMSRSGCNRRAWFEGGQMPIQRRVPKRGFNNSIFKKEYETVNLGQLAKIDVAVITATVLFKKGMIRQETALVKILGTGELSKTVTVEAHAFSGTARDKIVAAGGQAVVVAKKAAKKPTSK